MTENPNGKEEPSEGPETKPEPKVVIDFDELRRQRMCRKRYGRATVTISRTGSFGLFVGDQLSRQIQAYRDGKTTPEKVAWAWVRSRVEEHSPSFRWEDAKLERVVRLVADCSESPRIEAASLEGLAQELVAAQDREREQFQRLTKQLSASFTGMRNFTRVFNPPTLRWLQEQQRILNTLSRSFMPPSTRFPNLPAPLMATQLRELGLTASARRQLFPEFDTSAISQLRMAGLEQRVRLPDAVYRDLTATLRQTLGTYPRVTIPPALNTLAHERLFTIGQVVSAAREAAVLAEEEGNSEEAVVLEAITAEVVEVIESPFPAKLEHVVSELREHIDERFDTLERHRQADEERRQRDRRTDLAVNLILWFLSIYLAYLLWLLDQSPR